MLRKIITFYDRPVQEHPMLWIAALAFITAFNLFAVVENIVLGNFTFLTVINVLLTLIFAFWLGRAWRLT